MDEVCVPIEQVSKTRRKKSSLMSGILWGSLIGAGIALISAPYSGDETRSRLKNKGVEFKDKLNVKTHETREKVEEFARRSSERVGELKERGREALRTQKVNIESAAKGISEGYRTFREPELARQQIPMTGAAEHKLKEEMSLSTNVDDTDLTGSEPESGAA